MKKFKLILIMLLAILMLIPSGLQDAFAKDSKTLYLKNEKDIQKFAKDCAFDSFSKGLKVVLMGDIDLKDKAFSPIPIFAGIFDGNGHTIKGLSIDIEGSNQGFFRYLQKGAIIKNLQLEGSITPAGERANLGGLVGHNQGLIDNCSFSGYIKGEDTVGGLVGWNGNDGIILDSVTEGIIYGKRKIGGIAGYNAGTILRCANNLGVNTTVEEDQPDLGEVDFDNMDVEQLSKLSSEVTDIGGIAGVNTGIIKDSKNDGTIGYPQVGYNVGGIAGRQTGYIANCTNHGLVQGRKEVSGIVGQMEPNINIIIPPSKLEQLHKELNILHSSINRMILDTKHTSNEMSGMLSKIQDHIDTSKDHVNGLINMTENLVNQTGEIGLGVMDRITPIIKGIEDVSTDIKSVMDSMEKSLTEINKILEKLPEYDLDEDELFINFEGFVNRIKSAGDKMSQGFDDINNALEILLTGETEEVLSLLRSAQENLSSAIEDFSQGMEMFEELEKGIKDLISSLDEDTQQDLQGLLGDILSSISSLRDFSDKFESIYSDLTELLGYLMDIPSFDFDRMDDDYQKVREDLLDSMGDMSTTLSDFLDTLFLQSGIMIEDMENINNQMFLLMDLTFSFIGDLMDPERDLNELYEDVSRKDIDKKTEGKVYRCKNFGTVEGDINVGGIAGAMAIEFKTDPEDDLDIMKGTPINTIFQTNAIIQECENRGEIKGRKNNIGGIVGNMDLGYILDCIVSHKIESIDGSYVGGIAGKASGPIVSSYAKCILKGGNYIGGIAGYGIEIQDCYTLVKIEKGQACLGAIAGDMDIDNKVKGNYFVSHTLSGIDSISYMDKAEPIGYEKMMRNRGIPSIFKEFKLTFIADDKVVYSDTLNYRDALSQVSLPDLPEREGYYSKWEEFEEKHITFDTVIKAEYIRVLTALESKEKREGGLPIALVEGGFTHDDSLSLVYNRELETPNLKGKTLLENLTVVIPGDKDTSHTIRYLPPKGQKGLVLYTMTDGIWRKAKTNFDGKYLIIKTNGNSLTLCIFQKTTWVYKYMILAGIILSLILCGIYFKKSKKRFRSNTMAR